MFVFRVFFLESRYSHHRIINGKLSVCERTNLCFVNSLSGPSRIEASRKACGVGVCFILACNRFFSSFDLSR